MTELRSLRVRRISGQISTDDILPARIKHSMTEPEKMALHVFENRFPGFAKTLEVGDALVCDDIFGVGSSREQAVSALKAKGVRLVIAPAFGRIFFRNSWNLGLPAIALDPSSFSEEMRFSAALDKGCFLADRDLPTFQPPSQLMLDIYRAGGLLAFLALRAH